MARSGKRALTACCALLCLLPLLAQAALTARVDRTDIHLGDSFELTLSADGTTDPATVDLAPLTRDFEILQQSTRSSTRIVNGRTSRENALVLELTPRESGALIIPALSAGGEETRPIRLRVTEAAAQPGADQDVIFSASIDRESLYVQQQAILTLTIQQAIALDDRSVTELELENAYVKPLGQNSYQRSSGGRRWLVHEIRYAIFPQQSGELKIPEQTFAGRLRRGSGSLFDLSNGPRVSRRSEALSLQVKPRPANYPAATWLPAADLDIEESWSADPETLRTGDSVTRTVTLTAKGLQGAQLPPVNFPELDGLRHYPDKPSIEEADTDSGVVGLRTDSAALVPVRPGTYRLPELRIPWWDTEEDRLRYAVLPARELRVLPAPAQAGEAGGPDASSDTGGMAPAPAGDMNATVRLWQGVSAALLLGWLLSLAAMVWKLRRDGALSGARRAAAEADTAGGPTERRAWKQLQAACASDEPGAARRALCSWVASLPAPFGAASLAAFTAMPEGTPLASAVAELDTALFARGAEPARWRGDTLLQAAGEARRAVLRGSPGSASDPGNVLPPLYPGQA
jgi:hypothetical protein